LPDTGFAEKEDDSSAAPRRLVEVSAESAHLDAASHKRPHGLEINGVLLRPTTRRFDASAVRRVDLLQQELTVELLGFEPGLRAQSHLQCGDAARILSQRGSTPPLARVQMHEMTMSGFLRGIQGKQLDRPPNGLIDGATLLAQCYEARQRLHGQLTEP